MRKPLVLAIGFGLAALIGWILAAAKAPAQVTGSVSAGIAPIIVAVNEYLERRAKPVDHLVREVIRDDVYMNPILVAIYVVLALQFFEQTLGGLAGGAIALVLGTGVSDTVKTALALSFFVFLPFTAFAVVFIAKAAAHHLKDNQWLWIPLALVVSQIIGAIWAQVFTNENVNLSGGKILGYSVVTLGVLLVGAAGGIIRARRTHGAYLISRVYRHLAPADQQAFADLLESVPGER